MVWFYMNVRAAAIHALVDLLFPNEICKATPA